MDAVPKQRSVRTDERTRTEPSKSERTRERILDAAAKVLNRNGYAGTRLSDIAELAQVQAPALYYYFSSREELIEEVVTLGMARALEHVTEALAALPANASRLDRICAAVGAHLEVVLRLSDYASAAIRNGPQLPSDLRERQLVEQRTYGDVWRRLIDEARAAGEIHPELDADHRRAELGHRVVEPEPGLPAHRDQHRPAAHQAGPRRADDGLGDGG
jgi:AcrR family transcriptional regulator